MRGQLEGLQREHDDAEKQLAVRNTEVTHFKSQMEVYQESSRAHDQERANLQERWLQSAGETSELRRQVTESARARSTRLMRVRMG